MMDQLGITTLLSKLLGRLLSSLSLEQIELVREDLVRHEKEEQTRRQLHALSEQVKLL